MIEIEMPICYFQNYEEIDKGEKSGIKIEPILSINKTTFYVPENILIRINPTSEKYGNCTSLLFGNDEDSYIIDLDYETCKMLLDEKLLKKNND